MIQLSRYPQRDWQVRKRWDGRKLSLIRLTQIVDIGPFTETVWDSLDGARDLEAIQGKVATEYTELEAHVVEALVVRNLIEFAGLRMLEGSDL